MTKKIVLHEEAYLDILLNSYFSYKKECYGCLVGKTINGVANITSVVKFPAREKFIAAFYCPGYFSVAEDIARKFRKKEILGAFHSHTDANNGRGKYRYAFAGPSELDIEGMEKLLLICAVNTSNRKEDSCEFNSKYIRQVINTCVGRCSFKIRGYYKENKKDKNVEPLEITLTKNLKGILEENKKAGDFFKAMRIKRDSC